MAITPFYDATKTYYANFDNGPFGIFADGERYRDVTTVEEKVCGMSVRTPFGIPAGPLVNGSFMKAALDKGFDMPIHKTVRTKKRICHPYPNSLPVDIIGDLTLEKADGGLVTKDDYTEPLSITNSFGNPSYTPDFWQKDIADAVSYAREGQLVGASFEGTRWEGYSESDYIDDWVTGGKLLKETGVHFIEANLSCPNEGTAALLCYDINRAKIIASAIKDTVGDLPLFLKISYFRDNDELARLVKEIGSVVDGFAAINTISAEVRTPQNKQALPGEGRLRSGICGHSIKWAGLNMVKRLSKLRIAHKKSFSIIGVGGVMNANDYHEYKKASADAVMSATGAMWNPCLAIEIKESLKKKQ